VRSQPVVADTQRVSHMSAGATRMKKLAVREAPTMGLRARTWLDQREADGAITRDVGRVRSGDQDALRFLYLRYRGDVHGYVLSMITDPGEARAVTQQVFFKLASVIDTYDPRQAPFTSWLLRVVRSVALDHLRRQPAPPLAEHGNVVALRHPDDSRTVSDGTTPARAAIS
jgi:Sigma-70 region 2